MLLLALACITTSLGCNFGSGGPETVPVSGKVTYRGKPVEGAIVQFKPVGGEPAQPAVGKSGVDGVFQLTTREFAGAVAGKYQITVMKYESKQPAAAEKSSATGPSGENVEEKYTPPDDNARPAPGPKNMLPAKYADASKSGLTADVTPRGPNEFDLELVD
ncbi:hypothetical protein [Blastopirellula marina]|uniref:hypothetical protein n=1 Tax=Blastopirellula marina TaxID=124 RepID=UPI00103AE255|nr:hypothetical protein [Blastopirellula marina]